ncbi:hypothetical protein [Hydrogenophaga sp.]|uniref:hypothetical protein n=1 Tax=Hydrogenophaga sp. TaxID=1904254 RepID=UPI001AC20B98|nr:hypothetical protein [Hydrogenophaga sp.]MBN9370976.1 hypothetical protein [Hydrogenophaga sp.]
MIVIFKRGLVGLAMLTASPAYVLAQVPAILLEACSQLEPASKRVECLKAASGQAPARSSSQAPQSAYAPPARTASPGTAQFAPVPNTSYTSPGGKTCFVGPRGGTYTITKSGKKNYGGC